MGRKSMESNWLNASKEQSTHNMDACLLIKQDGSRRQTDGGIYHLYIDLL